METSGEVRVEQYYDRNTGKFLKLGKTGGTAHIHRCLWHGEVNSQEASAHYALDLIAQEQRRFQPSSPQRVLDLGCGIGSSMFYLSGIWPSADFEGVTLSQQQVDFGNDFARKMGGDKEIKLHHSSYLGLPEMESFDLAYAVESYIHNTNPGAFFHQAEKALKKDGLLIVLDDIPTVDPEQWPEEFRKYADWFKNGWLANCLLPVEEMIWVANSQGFEFKGCLDLSSTIEIWRPRDKAIAFFTELFEPMMRKHTYLNSLRGGHALQILLKNRLVSYRMMTFKKIRD